MKRIILKVPETTALDSLSAEQQSAIHSVFAQWVMPMPGTKVNSGYVLLDAVVSDSFNPDNIITLDLPFIIMGMWQWDGRGLTELQPLDASFIDYLPDTHTYDPETFEILTTTPPILHEPHRWAGWPEINL